jgi:outer membrane lipoprotein-sorting protein
MKKIFLCLILICLILTGCGKQSEKSVLNEFRQKVENAKSYYLSGSMELVNNEDIYLGLFVNKQDAINARIEAEKKYFKDFAPIRNEENI